MSTQTIKTTQETILNRLLDIAIKNKKLDTDVLWAYSEENPILIGLIKIKNLDEKKVWEVEPVSNFDLIEILTRYLY